MVILFWQHPYNFFKNVTEHLKFFFFVKAFNKHYECIIMYPIVENDT